MGSLKRPASRLVRPMLLVTAFALLHSGAEGMEASRPLGIVGKSNENGFPVIYKFVDEMPSEEVQARFPWVTVVSWKYDREIRNGMPPEETNKQMLALEDSLDGLAASGLCRHAYSRTGNGLKELVYYISDRDEFMDAFNVALHDQPRYPLEIDFYEDPQWGDFRKLRSLFKQH
jgi:hypothetical protein